MPFSFFGQSPSYRSFFSGYQPPAQPDYSSPSRLSLADLYQPAPTYEAYPQAPTYAKSVGDLDEEDRKRLRKTTMLKALKAMSEGWYQGRAGSALLSAALEMQQDRGDAIEDENRERDRQYTSAREMAMQALAARKAGQEEDQERAGAQNRLSMYEQIAAMDPELATQAEGAARSGSDSRLYELLAEARKRKAIREGGYGDPNDPFIDEKMEAKLKADEDERRRRALLDTLPDELKIRNEAAEERTRREIELRNAAETAQRADWMERGLLERPGARDDDDPRWEPDTVTMTDPDTGEPAIYMVDKSRIGPDGKPLMTKLGNARERADKGFQRVMVKDELGYDRPYVFDPTTGESRPDPNFQPNTQKKRQGGFLGIGGQEVDVPTGGYKYVPPAPPPAGQGSQARPAPRPTSMLDNPQGAPARGRGEGQQPADRKPSPQERAGVGRNPEDTSAAFARVVQQTGPLPLAVRQALKKRLAAGADEERETQMLLEAQGQGQRFSSATSSPEWPETTDFRGVVSQHGPLAESAIEADRIRSRRALGPDAMEAELRAYSRRNLEDRRGAFPSSILEQIDSIERVVGPLMDDDRKRYAARLAAGESIGSILADIQRARADWRP